MSGQELGHRLACPGEWFSEYVRPFDRYKGLDGVRLRVVHGAACGIDRAAKVVQVEHRDGR